MATDLDDLRRAVDGADDALLDALAARLAAVRAIGQWKRAHAVGAVDPAREERLRARWSARAAAAGVDPALADAMLAVVLDGCRAEVSRLVDG